MGQHTGDLEKRGRPDINMVEEGYRMILAGLGLEWRHNPHTKGTPRRAATAMYDTICGSLWKPGPKMTTFPLEGPSSMIVSKDIPVRSLCAHHLLPFVGEATVGYIPSREILGLSKMSRVVDWCSRRPQVQEKLTDMVAQNLTEVLFPTPFDDSIEAVKDCGVGVVIRARHMCMELRGVTHKSDVITSSLHGAFLVDQEVREEFLKLAGV